MIRNEPSQRQSVSILAPCFNLEEFVGEANRAPAIEMKIFP